MKRMLAFLTALFCVVAFTGCGKAEDDHKGHDHKPGEKHDH